MFCENCGMEMDKARFCPGCGAEQKSVVTANASIPVSEEISSATEAPDAPPPAPASENPEVASIPAASVPVPEAVSSAPAASIPAAASAPVPEAISSTPAASIPAASAPVPEAVSSTPAAPSSIPAAPAEAPQPSVIPNNGVPATVVPMGVSSSPTVVVMDESKRRTPERKYTGGHIALCLITAAVMAGIAGVFAGLYFSLLWAIR